MKFGKHTEFTEDFYRENMMGPSSVRILDELCARLELSQDMRILDLGCGTGLTSICLAKKDGVLAVSTPGLQREFGGNVPEEMKPFWADEVNATFHDMDWWKSLWGYSQAMMITDTFAHTCHALAWEDRLVCDNPYAIGDRAMMKAENGNYYAMHGLIARKR
jgi:16S rRNA A1518/A1519 N6-dimethyltransferase RsmA/KsgA/DIM1 with predicted DNA glycosylase/AP lyase activity